jgi:3-hydroxy-9,10-secoandrosta-1,3,5(10)-triene-9,17-dione monooxygenase reductase component
LNDGLMPGPAPDPHRFREAFGRFPTGVAVITAPGGGMTANAVCSLSLDPLLVLVCFDKTARTLPLVLDSGRFAVNILGLGQEGLAAHFASKLPEAEKLATVAHHDEDGVPVLDEALAWMVCDLERIEPGGDHEIGIGRVTSLGMEDGDPLVWYRGQYRALDG